MDKTSTAVAEKSLTLTVVGFVGMYTWELRQAKVWAASIAPTAGPGAWQMQSWDLTSVDLHWWPGENNTWEQFACILTVKVGLSTVSNSVLCETAQWAKGVTTEHTQRWTVPEKEYSEASLSVGVLQSHLIHTADQKHS